MTRNTEPKQKPIVFKGTGYRLVRNDPRNLELQVLGKNRDGKEEYQFKGYFGTVESALAHLIYSSSLLDETVTHDFKSYLQSIIDTKTSVISDIKSQLTETKLETEDLTFDEIEDDDLPFDEFEDDEFF